MAELARSGAAHLHQTYSAGASCANFSSTTTPVSHAGEGFVEITQTCKTVTVWVESLKTKFDLCPFLRQHARGAIDQLSLGKPQRDRSVTSVCIYVYKLTKKCMIPKIYIDW